ncbi:hypothetical protein MUN89_06730 [Halobacillus salinarum]|uniref:Uncharacterized protein n=1 Tax=Halobacillus salinarum TaxID=2932257 RepID=A0ABY4EME7_9BACI|nr:hypothetical protein [Halobacillus salinarum]UOQ45625.1 hypothetical protein MUN89_06730 [Halobacillus salinarum]
MNLKKIKLIIGLSLIALLLIGAGTAAYFLAFKDYGTADADVDQLVEDNFQLSRPDLTEEEAQAASAEPAEKESKQGGKKSVTEIKQAYEPTFNDLENQVKDRLQQLAEKAKEEYANKQADGKDISYIYFFSKYKSAADKLENKTDEAFDEVYHNMQDDLVANGHDPKAAKEMKKAYENQKEQLKSKVMEMAIDKF